jgi:hypothetical protein
MGQGSFEECRQFAGYDWFEFGFELPFSSGEPDRVGRRFFTAEAGERRKVQRGHQADERARTLAALLTSRKTLRAFCQNALNVYGRDSSLMTDG